MRWLIILLLIPLSYGLEWSEILFDAEGDDNGKEFVELLGTENLSGCTITDSKSTDSLELLQEGNDIILIVEEDGFFETDATIYSAGKAIGNGLGNSYENLTITCDELSLVTEYDITLLDGFTPGMSISFDGEWKVSNATPGEIELEVEKPPEPPERKGSSSRYCNTTLVITVSNTSGFPGDPILFTIVSAGYADFTVESNGTILLEGDTLTRTQYSFVLPEDDVLISAFARVCDAKQRAKRKILVLTPPIVEEQVLLNVIEEIPEENETVNLTPSAEPVPQNETYITANVVYDEDENIVPYMSIFGVVTLLVSAGLYRYERRNRD